MLPFCKDGRVALASRVQCSRLASIRPALCAPERAEARLARQLNELGGATRSPREWGQG